LNFINGYYQTDDFEKILNIFCNESYYLNISEHEVFWADQQLFGTLLDNFISMQLNNILILPESWTLKKDFEQIIVTEQVNNDYINILNSSDSPIKAMLLFLKNN